MPVFHFDPSPVVMGSSPTDHRTSACAVTKVTGVRVMRGSKSLGLGRRPGTRPEGLAGSSVGSLLFLHRTLHTHHTHHFSIFNEDFFGEGLVMGWPKSGGFAPLGLMPEDPASPPGRIVPTNGPARADERLFGQRAAHTHPRHSKPSRYGVAAGKGVSTGNSYTSFGRRCICADGCRRIRPSLIGKDGLRSHPRHRRPSCKPLTRLSNFQCADLYLPISLRFARTAVSAAPTVGLIRLPSRDRCSWPRLAGQISKKGVQHHD